MRSPPALRLLVAVMGLVGIGLVTWGAVTAEPGAIAGFVGAALILELLPARMRDDVYASLMGVVVFTAIIVGGPELAVCTAVGGLPGVARRVHNLRVERLLYNLGQWAVSAFAAGFLFWMIVGRVSAITELRSWSGFVGLLLTAVVYTVLNHGFVAVAIRLTSGERISSTMRSIATPGTLQILVDLGLSVLAAALLLEFGLPMLVLLIVPALVARQALLGFQEQADAYDRLVRAFVKVIEVKDDYTRGHAERVARLSVEVGRELDYTYEDLQVLRYSSLLHDVGKIAVPLEVLHKPGPLTDEEFDVIRQHPLTGARLLADIEFLTPAVEGVRYHHERLDGRGYPYGIVQPDIPEVARIVCAVDAFDAMTSTRPYREALPVDRARAELNRCAGTQFDPVVVRALDRAIDRVGWEPTVGPAPQAEDPAASAPHGVAR